MLSWVEHEKSFITSGPDVRGYLRVILDLTVTVFSAYWLPIVNDRHATVDGVLYYISKTRLFKYIENFISKNWRFSDKKLRYFFIFLHKI